jgi:type IV secretion system protein VirD4
MTRQTLASVYVAVAATGLVAATQWVGYRLAYHPALGGLHFGGGRVLYPPWALLVWAGRYGRDVPRTLDEGYAIAAAGLVLATLIVAAASAAGRSKVRVRELGRDRWATPRDLRAAGLLGGCGTVLGRTADGRQWLTYDGPEHQLVSGASRSGKGVGHVIPTLLNWTGSALVYDVKDELWQTTAGFRGRFGHVLRFNPTRLDSARFNPLLEVRKGTDEVRDVQNVVEMLVNPTGAKLSLDVWDQQASQLLVALVLHVLYTEPDGQKNLATVRSRLLDFRRTVRDMAATAHRLNAHSDEPEVHPEVALVARELMAQPEKFQASVRGTAASYLTLWADEVVARNTAASDFRLGDLACCDRPVTLYLQPPPSDAPRLRPLVRLVLNQACRTLMEHLDADSRGRPKRHRLLLMLDEFPTLGRLEFFTMNLRQMAAYGVKAHLVVQSFNDVAEAYGPTNTIIDNCHVLTAFASADVTTCERVSRMAGTVTEYREGYSGPRGTMAVGRRTVSLSEQVRPLLSPGDVRELGLDEQLVFVTGFRPMRVRKLRYFADPCLSRRALPPPDSAAEPDRPDGVVAVASDWAGEREKVASPPMPPVGQPAPTSPPMVPAVVVAPQRAPVLAAPMDLDLGDDEDELTDV